MTQENKITMMTVRELAKTGILTEHAIRLMVKQNKLPVLYIGKKALINYEKTVEMLQSLTVVPSQQKWTQKSFKKRNESYSFFCFRKTAAFIPRFA